MRLAKRHGIESIKNQMRRGFPDRSFLPPDVLETIYVEFKTPKTNLEPLQRKWCWHLASLGKPVFVIDSEAQFEALVIKRRSRRRSGTSFASRSR